MHVSGKHVRSINIDADSPEAALKSLPPSTTSAIVKENCFYYPLGCTLDCLEDHRFEFKGYFALTWSGITNQQSVAKAPHGGGLPSNVLNPKFTGKKPISRTLCAMANSLDGGVVLCGVTDRGQVGGLPFSNEEKEHVMLELSDLFSKFRPPVGPDRYRVNFVPVLSPDEVNEYISNQAPQSTDCETNIELASSSRDESNEFNEDLNLSSAIPPNGNGSADSPNSTNSILSKSLLDFAEFHTPRKGDAAEANGESFMNRHLLSVADYKSQLPREEKPNHGCNKTSKVEADSSPKFVLGSEAECKSSSPSSGLGVQPTAIQSVTPHKLHSFMHCWCYLQRVDRFMDGLATRRYVLRIEMLPQAFTTICSGNFAALSSDKDSSKPSVEMDELDFSDEDDASDICSDLQDEFLSTEPLSIKMPVFVESDEGQCLVRCLGCSRLLSTPQVQQLAEERALAALDKELIELRRKVRDLRQIRDQVLETA